MKKQILSANELAVLTALWSADRPLARPEILQRITKTDWNPNSINMILNNLIKKGYVDVGMSVRCGQNYGRTYYPLKTREECIASLAAYMLPDISEDERVLNVMAAMTKSRGISESTIQKLEQMLEQRRKEIRQEKVEQKKKE